MTKIRPTTKEAIIEAAFELLNKKPKASLAHIAKHAGVGRATLHRHFSGREDLILALTLQAIEETELAANHASKNSANYSEALEHIFKAMIPLGNRHWFLAQEQLPNHHTIKQKMNHQNKSLNQVISRAKQEGLFNSLLPNNWIMQTYDHLIHAAWVMIKSQQATTSQATGLAWQTLINGLRHQQPGQ